MGIRGHICCVCGMSGGGAAAKTARVAPLLRAGEAAMWRFQPLCRARWPFVGERAGAVRDGQTLFRGLSGEAWPLRGWGRSQEASVRQPVPVICQTGYQEFLPFAISICRTTPASPHWHLRFSYAFRRVVRRVRCRHGAF